MTVVKQCSSSFVCKTIVNTITGYYLKKMNKNFYDGKILFHNWKRAMLGKMVKEWDLAWSYLSCNFSSALYFLMKNQLISLLGS